MSYKHQTDKQLFLSVKCCAQSCVVPSVYVLWLILTLCKEDLEAFSKSCCLAEFIRHDLMT